MDVWFSPTRRVGVLSLSGELDLPEADRVRLALQRALGAQALVVVDLAAVTFLDSTIVGVLVAAQVRARAERKELVITNAGPRIAKVFRMLGLAPLLVDSEPPRPLMRLREPAV